jgi:hypothetical protein
MALLSAIMRGENMGIGHCIEGGTFRGFELELAESELPGTPSSRPEDSGG